MTQFNSDPDLLEFMADRQHDINEAMREASEADLKHLQQLQENFHAQNQSQTTLDTSGT
jgi:Tfp pilus assembly protein PilE